MYPNKIIITEHAIIKYRKRARSSKSDIEVKQKLFHYYNNATKIEYQNNVMQLMNNNYTDAAYYNYNNAFILVVCGNKLVTIYPYKKDKKRSIIRW